MIAVGTDVICKVTGETGKVTRIRPKIDNLRTDRYLIQWEDKKISWEERRNLIPQYPTIKPP